MYATVNVPFNDANQFVPIYGQIMTNVPNRAGKTYPVVSNLHPEEVSTPSQCSPNRVEHLYWFLILSYFSFVNRLLFLNGQRWNQSDVFEL